LNKTSEHIASTRYVFKTGDFHSPEPKIQVFSTDRFKIPVKDNMKKYECLLKAFAISSWLLYAINLPVTRYLLQFVLGMPAKKKTIACYCLLCFFGTSVK